MALEKSYFILPPLSFILLMRLGVSFLVLRGKRSVILVLLNRGANNLFAALVAKELSHAFQQSKRNYDG